MSEWAQLSYVDFVYHWKQYKVWGFQCAIILAKAACNFVLFCRNVYPLHWRSHFQHSPLLMRFLTSFTNVYIVPAQYCKRKNNEAHFTLSKCCDTRATQVFQWSLRVDFNGFFGYTFRVLRGDAFRLSLKLSTYSGSGATLLRIIDFCLWAGAGLRPAMNCSKVTRISILSNWRRLWFRHFLIPTKQKHLLFFIWRCLVCWFHQLFCTVFSMYKTVLCEELC